MSHNIVLHIKDASIGYKKALVSNINAELKSGEICLLMGNNGQGKTTLIKSILGQLNLLSGEIEIAGTNLNRLTPKEIAQNISIVFSKATTPVNFTVKDLISLGKYVHYPYYFSLNEKDIQDIESIINRLNLTELQNTKLVHLSDGNLQKAFIGRALAQNTPIIILDEPTTHLDEDNRKIILNLLKEIAKKEDKAILFSSHDIFGASEVADTIWKIENHQMQSGLAEDILYQHLQKTQKESAENSSFPTINAPELEKHLLENAISKQVHKNCSEIHIFFENNSWIVKSETRNNKFSSISEVVNWLNSGI